MRPLAKIQSWSSALGVSECHRKRSVIISSSSGMTFSHSSVFTERLISDTKSHSKNIGSLRTESKVSDNRKELAELGVIFFALSSLLRFFQRAARACCFFSQDGLPVDDGVPNQA